MSISNCTTTYVCDPLSLDEWFPTAGVSNEPYRLHIQCSNSVALLLSSCSCAVARRVLVTVCVCATELQTVQPGKIPDEWHQLAKTGSGRAMGKKYIIYKTKQFLCASLGQIGIGGVAPFILSFGDGRTSVPAGLFTRKGPRVGATWAVERVWMIWTKVPCRETNRISLAAQPAATSLQLMQYSGVLFGIGLR